MVDNGSGDGEALQGVEPGGLLRESDGCTNDFILMKVMIGFITISDSIIGACDDIIRSSMNRNRETMNCDDC